jgi:formamidopyrimidine-DNA glycosylase
MPELPEVEVTRRALAARMAGAVVQDLHLGKPLRWPLGSSRAALIGQVVGAAQRRGKYIWLPLSGAPNRRVPSTSAGLLLHLGMSGSLRFGTRLPAAGVHDHFELVTDKGTLRLTDPRRFGAVVWSPALTSDPAAKLLRGLGSEPFDESFDDAALHAALRKRRGPIKNVLLGGQVVVGVGNIYASEALFQAAIDPRLPSQRISRPRARKLLAAIRGTLARAIELGGSTLRDFRNPHGVSGAFQNQAQVYGRSGQPCPRCTAPIKRLMQGQRASYFCAACQRR